MTKLHNALFVRYTCTHFHAECVPVDYVPRDNDVHLDMNTRANIAQCLHVLCYECGKPLVLFPDRKQIVLRQWPDMTIPDVDQAVAFAQAAIGQLVIDQVPGGIGMPYTVLHAWTVPPLEREPGQVVAICELEEFEEEPVTPPPSTDPLARERFTPPLWKSQHIGTAKCWELIASARDDETIGIIISSEADARLIAEAPNMFALLKEYLKQHAAYQIEGEPNCEEWPCHECEATRCLMQRVLGEA